MNIFYPSHLVVLQKLIHNHVQFLLIGGYAVIFHGYNRTTGDMDIWIGSDYENKKRFIQCMEELDIRPEVIKFLYSLDFDKAQAFSIGEEPQKIDFLTKVNLLSFEDAFANKMIASLDGLDIPYLHYKDLVLMKINTSRIKDKADVEELQRIQNFRKSKE